MASRLGLARIIDWGRACDREELAYVLVRLTAIARERNDRERETLLPGKQKRTTRTKKPTNAQETAAQMGIPETEKAVSA